MAVLKKGSKGPDVKNLQAMLNKQGAKPKLTEDGDFGAKTEDAVKVFQKKAKVKVDGQAGEFTLAALRYGGPLPLMTVESYEKRRLEFQKVWNNNQANIKSFIAIGKDIGALNDVTSKEVPAIDKRFVENYAGWKQVAALSDKIVARQKEYDTLLTKDPVKAAAAVKDCEKLHAEIEKIGEGRISPNAQANQKSVTLVRSKLEAALKAIQRELAEVDKRREAY